MADKKTQNIEDLKKDISGKREELRVIRFKESGSRARNVRLERNLRRDIARLLTDLRSRDIAPKAKTK